MSKNEDMGSRGLHSSSVSINKKNAFQLLSNLIILSGILLPQT